MRAMEYTPVQCRCQPIGQWTLLLLCLIHGPQIEPTKKLTDAECAAEYWRARHQVTAMARVAEIAAPGEVPKSLKMRDTWHRFATQPHTDEADS
ncbi:hypothetical protein [Micrococcus terreus]|uniref:hypothetical protein n=1 Tax=Micrococcus terreus TaxID=574650 RepID=UPI003D758BAC